MDSLALSRQALAAFEPLLEALPDAVLCMDPPSGRLLAANASALKTYGHDRDDLLSLTVSMIVAPEAQESMAARMAAGGSFDSIHRRKDGSTFPVEVNATQATVGHVPCVIAVVRDMGRHAAAESNLRQGEERLRMAVNVARLGIWEWDPGRDITTWNDEMLRIYGVRREEFTGKGQDYINFTREDYRTKQKANIGNAFEHGVTEAQLLAGSHVQHDPKELCIVRPDGTECFTSGDAIALVDAAGKPLRMLGITVDITQRKRVEESLRASEAALKRSQAVAHVGDWIWDTRANKVTWSEEMQRIFGLDPQVFDGDLTAVVQRAIHPDDAARVEAMNLAVVRGGAPAETEYRVVWPDGTVRHVWAVPADRVVDGAGAIVRLSGIVQDITERKQAEAAVTQREQELDAIIRSAMDGFLMMDLQGRLLRVNESYCRMSGYSEKELLSMRIMDLEALESPQETATQLRSLTTTGSARFETRHRRKDGTLFDVEVSSQFQPGSEGRVVAFLRDLTQRNEAQATQRSIEHQLHQSQKMEALGTLAGGIAHDFNNILGAVMGYAELSQAEVTPGSEVDGNLREIFWTASARARDLVKQILAFSRRSQEKPQLLFMEPTIEETVKMLRSTVPSTIDVVWNAAGKPVGCVLATATHIHQVVMNLGTNAYQAMKATGGRIHFSVGEVRLEGDGALRKALRPGRYAALTCEDNGPGIPPEHLPKIFDPFFTTRPKGEGTGSGLSVVHGIVRSMGGTVEAESVPGKGALLRVLLPLADAGPAQANAPRTSPDARLSGRVLVVDDDPVLASVMAKFLERMGLAVTASTHPREALEVLRNSPSTFALVVTDQTMPGITGGELLVRAREAGVKTPMIVCTGHSDVLDAEEASRLGFVAYLRKPVDMAPLRDAVAGAMGQQLKVPGA